MAEKNVWFVMSDSGGTNNVLPVALKMRELWGSECKVKIIADENGKASEIISKYNSQFLRATSPAYCLGMLGQPDLIVTSMCSGNSLGRKLVAEFKGKCATVAIPDSPWGRYEKEWNDPKYYPDYLIVNDQVCKDNALKIWTDYDPEYIKIFGWPYLDQYLNYDIRSARKSVMELCANRLPIVTFLGQLDGTSKVLREVILALNAIGIPVNFIPRLHPRCSDLEKAECVRILQEFKSGSLIMDSSELDTSTIIAGSNVVLSVYSLSLIEAAALKKQGISVITESGYEMFQADLGNVLKPCFGEVGYSHEVHNLAELTMAIQKGIKNDLYAEIPHLNKRVITVDGKNSEWVANFIAHGILGI